MSLPNEFNDKEKELKEEQAKLKTPFDPNSITGKGTEFPILSNKYNEVKHLGVGKTINLDEFQDVFKKELEEAYNAGRNSVSNNFIRQQKLLRGNKEIEEEQTFDSWYNNHPRKQSDYFRKYQKIAEAGFAPIDHNDLSSYKLLDNGNIISPDDRIIIGIDIAHKDGDKTSEALIFYNDDNSITFIKGDLKGKTFPVAEALKLHEKEKEKLKSYEEKFIVELFDSSPMYYSETGGNLFGGAFSTHKPDAKNFDNYQAANDAMIECLKDICSSNPYYVGSVCKITKLK